MSIKRTFKLVISFILVLIGSYFSMIFQDMAYWGEVHKGVPNTLVWYWIGATLSYAFSISAVIIIVIRDKSGKMNTLNSYLMFLSILLATTNFLWTTFIIIAGQSGF